MEVDGDHGILAFATSQEEWGCTTFSLADRHPASTAVQQLSPAKSADAFFHTPDGKGGYTRGLQEDGETSPSRCSADEGWRRG